MKGRDRGDVGHGKIFVESAANGALDGAVDFARLAETDLHFGRMDIDIHRVGREGEVEDKHGETPDHEHGVIRFDDGVRDGAVFNPTPVYENVLKATVAAMDGGGGDVAADRRRGVGSG